MSTEPTRALLFDMDGVVIDTHASVEHFWNQLAQQHRVALTDEDFERFIHGTQSHVTIARYFPKLTAEQRHRVERDIALYEDELTYTLMSGVLDLLAQLKSHNIPTALVTSGSQRKVDAVFAQVDLSDKFDTIVTADIVTRGKPDPECYALAAKQLACPPEQCIVFEDSISGTRAALTAGAHVIGVGKTGILLEIGATHVIPNFDDACIHKTDEGHINLSLPSNPKVTFVIREI